LLAVIVVSALGAQFFVPPNGVGPDLQLIVPAAYAQHEGKGQGSVTGAPAGHRQPTVQDLQNVQKSYSADEAMRKMDDNLKKNLQGICRGC
jgi:hypothetical protein